MDLFLCKGEIFSVLLLLRNKRVINFFKKLYLRQEAISISGVCC